MSYYPRNYSKGHEDHVKEMARLRFHSWNYKKKWLKFIPSEGVPPLSFEELKELRDRLPEKHQFAFAKIGKTFSCDNIHGSRVLLNHGYVPVFETEENAEVLGEFLTVFFLLIKNIIFVYFGLWIMKILTKNRRLLCVFTEVTESIIQRGDLGK